MLTYNVETSGVATHVAPLIEIPGIIKKNPGNSSKSTGTSSIISGNYAKINSGIDSKSLYIFIY